MTTLSVLSAAPLLPCARQRDGVVQGTIPYWHGDKRVHLVVIDGALTNEKAFLRSYPFSTRSPHRIIHRTKHVAGSAVLLAKALGPQSHKVPHQQQP